jgi:hypothetical protein
LLDEVPSTDDDSDEEAGHDGAKKSQGQLKNLVIVLVFRTEKGGQLKQIALHNMCSDPKTRSTSW